MRKVTRINALKLVELINRVQLFKGLEVQERENLAFTPGIVNSIDAGETFIVQGQYDRNLFIVLSGTASVLMNRHKVTEVGAGAFLGEFGFLFEEQRNSSVVAETDIVALKLDRESFDSLHMVVKEKIKDRLVKGLIDRVQQQNASIVKLKAQLQKYEEADEEA